MSINRKLKENLIPLSWNEKVKRVKYEQMIMLNEPEFRLLKYFHHHNSANCKTSIQPVIDRRGRIDVDEI
ncbi:7381_t:CDS:2 [Diversispora eburnea]|uniref:7381_t:CDS:1 n=1 Tax=Diversispora eburnea TaxID=1213867 RepID=A0A9N9BEH5_9GLOM|nr:7381_t:CDS:2 [Diversispora eburnea]